MHPVAPDADRRCAAALGAELLRSARSDPTRPCVFMKQQRSGVIVNVGSIAGKMTLPWFTLYSASKYAIGSLTDGLRMELRTHRHPYDHRLSGYVKTRFQQNVLHGTPPPLADAARTVGDLSGKMRRRYHPRNRARQTYRGDACVGMAADRAGATVSSAWLTANSNEYTCSR